MSAPLLHGRQPLIDPKTAPVELTLLKNLPSKNMSQEAGRLPCADKCG
jgi:hypothetical protein